jgi:hypothetical protein
VESVVFLVLILKMDFLVMVALQAGARVQGILEQILQVVMAQMVGLLFLFLYQVVLTTLLLASEVQVLYSVQALVVVVVQVLTGVRLYMAVLAVSTAAAVVVEALAVVLAA